MVSGAIALMLQANPSLTPNLIKGILEFTAISKPGVSALRQGAGFMNVSHAVALAALAARPYSTAVPIPTTWARHIMWGNHMVSGGVINPKANAWRLGVEWGWATTKADAGNLADDGDNIVWGTMNDGDNIVWGTATMATTSCGAPRTTATTSCGAPRTMATTSCGALIAAAPTATTSCGVRSDGDNIVWGTANDGDNIVWGTSDGDNIVWGTADDGDNIVWGTANVTNTVWPIFKGGK